MKKWLVICNTNLFDIQQAFRSSRTLTWPYIDGIQKDDIIYFYVTAPVCAILYQCKVTNNHVYRLDENSKKCVLGQQFYNQRQIYMAMDLEREFPPDSLSGVELRKIQGCNLQLSGLISAELGSFILQKTNDKSETEIKSKNKNNQKRAILIIACFLLLVGSGGYLMERTSKLNTTIKNENSQIKDKEQIKSESDSDSNKESKIEVVDEVINLDSSANDIATNSNDIEELTTKEAITFVDTFGENHQSIVEEGIAKSQIIPENFRRTGQTIIYEDDRYYTRQGIDVSYYQGDIDWSKVKATGIEFVFIRIGRRGYGQEGKIELDQRFHEYIMGAQAVGLDVGVYFFSQAININEAEEEAEFIIENLQGYQLQLPVAYEPERIFTDEARTDNVTGNQFTDNAIAFCRRIEAAGYKPIVYSNAWFEFLEFDMSRLMGFPFYYADYERLPQTPYKYEFWQYTDSGSVNGIKGTVARDLQFIEK